MEIKNKTKTQLFKKCTLPVQLTQLVGDGI